MNGFGAAVAGLALCVGALVQTTSVRAADQAADQAAETELEIGYMPILPVAQLFVELENGWLDEAGVEARLVSFQNGPAMVQALLAGQLDVAHVGIGPAMVARARGADIKVVAASIEEQVSFIGLESLAPFFDEGDAATAFARFREANGRRPIISTFPVGSVPETVLQFWLRRRLGADPDDMEIIYQGAAQVQQALLTGAVDGAMILEPTVTTVTERVPGARVIARGGELFPDQPGAIMAVRESLIAEHPELVEALVAAHVRATAMLNDEPDAAAAAAQKYVGGGRLPLALVEKAVRNSKGQFVADPNAIVEGTRVMHDFQSELGTLKAPLDIDALFDLAPYAAASAKR